MAISEGTGGSRADGSDGAARSAGVLPGRVKAAVLARFRDGGVLPPERQLCDELAITRHQLRRVLAELRADELVPAAQAGRRPTNAPAGEGSEFFARVANPLEVVELRLVLEPALARFAAVRASSLEIARISKLATTAPGAESGAADVAFHQAVAQAARNGLGGELYALLRRVGKDQRVRIAGMTSTCPKRIRERDTEHRRVADAIAAREGAQAEQAMREHLLIVQSRIVERMAPGGAVA